MSWRIVLLFIGATLFLQNLITAQTADTRKSSQPLPPIILSGLQAYKEKGPDEAIKAWIKDSPIDGSKEALGQANNLRMIENFYGSYSGYEVVSTRAISPRTQMFFLVLNFEKGPLFARFLVYRSESGWIVTSLDFNTKSELIPSWPTAT